MDVFAAIDSGDPEKVRELLRADPAAAGARAPDGLDAVRYAAYRMRPDLVAEVLAAGPDLDVFAAATAGDVDRLTALLDADPAAATAYAGDGFTPLHLAAFFRQPAAARLLLDRGADPEAEAANPSRVRPLHSAAAAGEVEVARMLLDAGAAVGARQQGGFTALMAAAQNGDAALTALLLERGADPALRDDTGVSAADRMPG